MSGGYGAMVSPMLRPDLFGGLATHAGDAQFEPCYQTDVRARRPRVLRDDYDGSFERCWADFRRRPAFSKPGDGALLNESRWLRGLLLGRSGRHDPPSVRPRHRRALIPEVWERWLRWDPVRMARTAEGAAALRSLRAIYIDAGDRDEYFLDLGAESFRRECVAAGAPSRSSSSSTAKHGAIEYRYPIAIRYLAERLAG